MQNPTTFTFFHENRQINTYRNRNACKRGINVRTTHMGFKRYPLCVRLCPAQSTYNRHPHSRMARRTRRRYRINPHTAGPDRSVLSQDIRPAACKRFICRLCAHRRFPQLRNTPRHSPRLARARHNRHPSRQCAPFRRNPPCMGDSRSAPRRKARQI